MSTDEYKAAEAAGLTMEDYRSRLATRYTVRMLGAFVPGLDINGVCHVVRDALESGLIPVISIDLPEGGIMSTDEQLLCDECGRVRCLLDGLCDDCTIAKHGCLFPVAKRHSRDID